MTSINHGRRYYDFVRYITGDTDLKFSETNMQLVHTYPFNPETYTGTLSDLEKTAEYCKKCISMNLGYECLYFFKCIFGDIYSKFSDLGINVIFEKIAELYKEYIPTRFGANFSCFIGYTLGDADIEFSDLPMDVILMTMHREDYPYTVYSLSKYISGGLFAPCPNYEVKIDFPAMYPTRKFNEDVHRCDGVYMINLTFQGDKLEILSDGDRETYNWYGKYDLWHNAEINDREIMKGNIDMVEFNKYCLDFLTDELINSFDSYESIDVSIGYTRTYANTIIVF